MTSSTQNRDPVCGMTVQESPTVIDCDYAGVRYLFCAEGCKEQFQENPAQYVRLAEKPRRSRLAREIVITVLLFLVALAAVLVFRTVREAWKTSAYDGQRQSVVMKRFGAERMPL